VEFHSQTIFGCEIPTIIIGLSGFIFVAYIKYCKNNSVIFYSTGEFFVPRIIDAAYAEDEVCDASKDATCSRSRAPAIVLS
jgi:hypothetical protein